MPSQSEIEQTLKMFEHGTKQKWRVIPKSQARYYPHAGQKNQFWVLCLDTSCKGQIYVVRQGQKPHYSDYDKILRFLRKKGLPILPKINVNLTDFPAQPYSMLIDDFSVEGTIKPLGSLSLKSIHSKSPLTYTPGKLANIKYSSSRQVNEYMQAWSKISLIKHSEDGKLTLKISNSITNQYYDFDASLEGNVFSATITLTPDKTVIGGEWIVEGQLSFKVTGMFIDVNAAPPPRKSKSGNSVLAHHNQMGHSVYYMIGVGVGAVALGAMTVLSGGADIPVIAGITAGAGAIASS